MKKKIAFVMPWFLPMPPVQGGAVETLVDTLLRENERTKRYQFTVFSRGDPAAQQAYAGYTETRFVPIDVPAYQHRLAGLYRSVCWKLLHYGVTPGTAYLRAVQRAMRGQRFDHIIVENQAPFAEPISRMGIGPVDLHMHNIAIANEQPKLSATGAACRRLIAVSDYISDWMTAHMGGSAEKNRVLLNCIDSPRFAAGGAFRQQTREALGIQPGEIVFLYTGRMLREKGALELAQAFVRADIPASRLVYVGSQWFGESQTDAYQREVQRTLSAVRDRVILTGFTAYADMPKYYAAADIAVLPSIWDEPSGLTVLEAQAAGLPLIATRSGGIPQNVAPDGAILVERGDTLVENLAHHMRALAGDPAQRQRMAESARAWSKHRTPQGYFEAFCALMDEE